MGFFKSLFARKSVENDAGTSNVSSAKKVEYLGLFLREIESKNWQGAIKWLQTADKEAIKKSGDTKTLVKTLIPYLRIEQEGYDAESGGVELACGVVTFLGELGDVEAIEAVRQLRDAAYNAWLADPADRALGKLNRIALGNDQTQELAALQNIPLTTLCSSYSNKRYDVVKTIGSGGFGVVYEARQQSGPRVAIKTLRADDSSSIRDEGRLLRRLRHTNIVEIIEMFTEGGTAYMVLEYVEGGSLATWINTCKLFSGTKEDAVNRIIRLSLDIALGLSHAHEKGVIHRDIKPANVLIASGAAAKVADFGVAKCRTPAHSPANAPENTILMTVDGAMTLAYCSPEQFRNQKVSTRSDCWSWGLTVLHMFAGRVYWDCGTNAGEALRSFVASGALGAKGVQMPRHIIQILQKCFHQSPEERPDAKEIAACLETGTFNDGVVLDAPPAPPAPTNQPVQAPEAPYVPILKSCEISTEDVEKFCRSLEVLAASKKRGFAAIDEMNFEKDDFPGDYFFCRMSIAIKRLHGALIRIKYSRTHAGLVADFFYADGTTIRSGQADEKVSIHFLKFGETGIRANCTRLFLGAAGIKLSCEQISSMRVGTTIELNAGRPIIRYRSKIIWDEAEIRQPIPQAQKLHVEAQKPYVCRGCSSQFNGAELRDGHWWNICPKCNGEVTVNGSRL